MMTKINDDETRDGRMMLTDAAGKAALLSDLFVGAGNGEWLNLSDRGLGLRAILTEIADICDAVQEQVEMPGMVLPPRTERRVN